MSTTQDPTAQRRVIIMCDGLGPDYFKRGVMPTLSRWAERGIYRDVEAVMPSVTNTNNASICCGAFPAQHGVIGNSYLDTDSGREEYLESSELLSTATLFDRAARLGVRSALLTSKSKTTALLGSGAEIKLAAEAPEPEWVARLGQPPAIYSREINYWLLQAAETVLRERPDIGCVYVHTTDYAMHTWPPEHADSDEHLRGMDEQLAALETTAPDAAFLVAADHGMNAKRRCWDLNKACERRGVPLRMAISAERDQHLRHHRGLGGTAWVYLKDRADQEDVRRVLEGLAGVERVLAREEAVASFGLMAQRIGDLVVLGDRETVFGHLDSDCEELPATYRSYGSTHERAVPLIIYNAPDAPAPAFFRYNADLARWLYRANTSSQEQAAVGGC